MNKIDSKKRRRRDLRVARAELMGSQSGSRQNIIQKPGIISPAFVRILIGLMNIITAFGAFQVRANRMAFGVYTGGLTDVFFTIIAVSAVHLCDLM